MPTLNWIGKEAVVKHHQEVPFHLLRCKPELSVGEAGSGNLLIEGDNLLALKALLPYYAGQVKCIYIDPPYNTGEESWVYSDSVTSPVIQEWLGNVVGKETEDLSRHDKWLCMMYPRLVLLRELLHEEGSIWISLDDNEMHHARTVLDEIFGGSNFVATVVWQRRTSPDARLPLGPAHDYIVVYAKALGECKRRLNKLPLKASRAKDYRNLDDDPRGQWASVDITGQVGHATPSQFYEITTPSGRKYRPPEGRCWAISENTFKQLVEDKRIWFGRKGNSRPRLKRFLSEVEGTTAWTWWPHDEVGHNQEATKELKDLLEGKFAFETPKPLRLICRILQIATNPGDLVLDSFAGSGTTGHAVLQLNREDAGNRRFILVEIEPPIARPITAVRLQRAIEGYEWTGQQNKVNRQEGMGGGFRYCTLGRTLFDAQGQIRGAVTFADLAQHVFFTETGEPLPQATAGETPLLGVANGIAVYLLYNGILRDKTSDGGNVLTRAVLANLPPHGGPRVIYGNGCLLSPAFLQQAGITFRQIPYEVRVS